MAADTITAEPAAAAGASALSKSAQDLTNPGANPVNHGDTLNWVTSYTDNATSQAPASITDAISGAKIAQTYVPGSLKVPPQWTPSWSTDGTTFQSTDPGTGTVAVGAGNPAEPVGGTSVTAALSAPSTHSSVAPTGGDGFTPILYRAPNGDLQAWNIYHHLVAAAPKVVCSDLTTGTTCAGGPWPKPLNTTPGPLGSGSTGDIASTLVPEYVTDPGRPGVVYYPALTASSVGIGCLDLGAQANCGYFPLESAASPNTLGGIVAAGGNIYGAAGDGRVLCLNIASQAPCPGQPYAAVTSPNGQQTQYTGALAVADGKVFISVTPPGSEPEVGCFDPSTSAACAGWETAKTVAPAGYTNYDVYPAYDTAGNAVGVCATSSAASLVTTCFTFDGGPLAAPSWTSSLPAGVLAFEPTTVTAPDGHLKSYFAAWGGSDPGSTSCWDWTDAALCSGFPAVAGHPNVNGGATRDYGYAYDDTSQCLFGLGDAGVLFSEDPATGGSPCTHSAASTSLTPSAFYCDGGTGHVQGYAKASLEGINLADVDLAASTAVVTDPNGTPITRPAFAADGTLDLSGIPIGTHPSIDVTVHLVLDNANDFTGSNRPSVVVSFAGDAPQVCFQTTVTPTDCSVTSVTNTATGTDGTGPLTSNTVTLPVAAGTMCTPELSVTNTGSPNPVISGNELTYTLTVADPGGQSATAVSLTDALPSTEHFRSVSTTQGSCTGPTSSKGGSVTCRIGNLAAGGTATVKITVLVTKPGPLSATATAVATNVTTDADDHATATVTVKGD